MTNQQEATGLLKKAAAFLQDLFLERPMYSHLHNFKGVLTKLHSMEAATGAETKLDGFGYIIEMIAQLPTDKIGRLFF